MFFSEKQMKKADEEAMKKKLESDFMDFIIRQMLESDVISEKDKLSLRVGQAVKEVNLIIHDHILIRYAKPGEEADEETLSRCLNISRF